MVDIMGIVKSKYYSEHGNFIQFYITSTEILTYLPDNYKIETIRKEMFEKEFERSFHISSHWNLRKVALTEQSDSRY